MVEEDQLQEVTFAESREKQESANEATIATDLKLKYLDKTWKYLEPNNQ